MTYTITQSNVAEDEEFLFSKDTIVEKTINLNTNEVEQETFWTPNWKKVGESFFYEDGGEKKEGYIIFGRERTEVVFVTERALNDAERNIFPDGYKVKFYNDAADEGKAIKGIFLDKEGQKLGEEFFHLNGAKGGFIIKGSEIFGLGHEERPKTKPPFKPVIDPLWNELTVEQRDALFDGRFSVTVTPEQCERWHLDVDENGDKGAYIVDLNISKNRFLTVYANGAQVQRIGWQFPLQKSSKGPAQR